MDRHAWDDRYRDREWLWTVDANRFVVQEVGGLTPGTALDLAAGEGRNAVWLAREGWTVTAVDFSAVALGRASDLAAREGVTITTVEADLRSYVPPVGVFDLVVLAYLHLPPDTFRDVLAGAANALAPGGTLVIVGHDLTNIEHGYGGPQSPEVLYTPEDLIASLGPLDIVKAEKVDRPYISEEGEFTAIDALVVAQKP
ncbi:MAG: class I SAM-dependent methyltransferase [Acidimicrobiia bacterium]|nr:class I SAM-dependent methyltransferase [Acidimicrobiia bacterium]